MLIICNLCLSCRANISNIKTKKYRHENASHLVIGLEVTRAPSLPPNRSDQSALIIYVEVPWHSRLGKCKISDLKWPYRIGFGASPIPGHPRMYACSMHLFGRLPTCLSKVQCLGIISDWTWNSALGGLNRTTLMCLSWLRINMLRWYSPTISIRLVKKGLSSNGDDPKPQTNPHLRDERVQYSWGTGYLSTPIPVHMEAQGPVWSHSIIGYHKYMLLQIYSNSCVVTSRCFCKLSPLDKLGRWTVPIGIVVPTGERQQWWYLKAILIDDSTTILGVKKMLRVWSFENMYHMDVLWCLRVSLPNLIVYVRPFG